MNPGDKIKLTRGGDTGKIISKSGNNQYDIELDDGFTIQVHISEITLVESSSGTPKEEPEVIDEPVIIPEKSDCDSLSLRLDNSDARTYKINFNNSTNFQYHLFLFNNNKGISSHIVEGKSSIKVILNTQEVERGELLIKFVKFSTNTHPFPMKEIKVNLSNTSDFDNKENIYLIKYLDGYQGHENVEIDAQQLAASMQGDKPISTSVEAPPSEVDLHMEELVEEGEPIPEENQLSIQLSKFQSALDNAIACNMDQITFIHGVGNGILRMEIHKRLSRRGDIQWFKDADKQKFGFGATFVQLK